MYAVAAVQVIMAAIDDSDGTRLGVQRAIFSGSGVKVPARTSVLGKTLKIDPATGDVNLKDFTALVIRSRHRVVLQGHLASLIASGHNCGGDPAPHESGGCRTEGGKGAEENGSAPGGGHRRSHPTGLLEHVARSWPAGFPIERMRVGRRPLCGFDASAWCRWRGRCRSSCWLWSGLPVVDLGVVVADLDALGSLRVDVGPRADVVVVAGDDDAEGIDPTAGDITGVGIIVLAFAVDHDHRVVNSPDGFFTTGEETVIRR